MYFLGSRRPEISELSNMNGEQHLFHINDTLHDETDDFDGVSLPSKLLKLQLLRTNEGICINIINTYS